MVTPADEYKAVAARVVSTFRDELGVELKYDKQSVEWLDGYINRVGPELQKESVSGLAVSLGAYLGETIIATYGGAWSYFEQVDQWGIRFEDDNGAFPISKVYKQLEDGAYDSILSFFTMLPKIPDLVNHHQSSSDAQLLQRTGIGRSFIENLSLVQLSPRAEARRFALPLSPVSRARNLCAS